MSQFVLGAILSCGLERATGTVGCENDLLFQYQQWKPKNEGAGTAEWL